MFWPGMNSQIEDAVSNCSACTKHQSSNPKETMIAHKLPDRPWQNVATNLFELHNEQYLIAVDYYSKYFELERMPTTTSPAVINKLKSSFSRHGIPEKVFPTTAHRSLRGSRNFNHVTISPTYPQSNGLAEKAVHTAEQLLRKVRLEQRDPYPGLLEYRNTPVDSLAQLLMSRHLRSIFPTTSNHLRPRVVRPDLARERMDKKQGTQRHHYNHGARELKPLVEGEEIHIQTKSGNWKPATVLGHCSTPKSNAVRTSNGRKYPRTRGHSLKIRSMSAKENPWGQADKLETPTATSESMEETESEPTLNQNPTAYPPTQNPCNEPCVTRSGRVVKPPVKLDL